LGDEVLKTVWRVAWFGAVVVCLHMGGLCATELPHIRMENGTGQLIVKGQLFLIFGGELGNSSAGTAAQADEIVPKLARLHVNTILMPVAWEQIEPKEDSLISASWITGSK
jgi:hypothetical protein